MLVCTVAWVILVLPTVAAAPTCEQPVRNSAIAATEAIVTAVNFFKMYSLSG